jgi:transposase-like protein
VLASDLLSHEGIARLRDFIGNRPTLLLPVVADELTGFNAIPDAMAQVLGNELGTPVVAGEIVQTNKVGHTGAPAFQRLVTPAPFEGQVQADANYVLVDDHVGLGGTLANLRGYVEARGRGAPGKTIVMGLISRDGPMKAVVIPNVKKDTLRGVVLDNVEPGSVVSTDELYSYNLLTGDGFTHGAVKHGAKEYAHYDYRTGETFHVNTVEGFWRLFKASVRSTHVQISAKHMQRYLSEFTFRASNRERVNGMFDLLVGAL